MNVDLAVIGAGPAGSTAAAVAARSGMRVAIFERGSLPHDRVCGEFVSAEGLSVLEELAPGLLSEAPEIRAACFVDARGRCRRFPLPRPARGLSRLALDAALWECAGASGAELRPRSTIAGRERQGEIWRLQVAGGEAVTAMHVLDATGRCGTRSPWVGVKARFEGVGIGSEVEMHLFPGGYCGLAPVERGWVNVCALMHKRQAGDLSAASDFAGWVRSRSGSASLSARLRGARQATPTVVTAQVGLGPQEAMRNGALAAGDASGFLDPFAGDGLARAMLSGQLAANLLAQGRPHAYAQALARAADLGFAAAVPLRALVRAPQALQSFAAWLLARPALGPRLVTATRWRS